MKRGITFFALLGVLQCGAQKDVTTSEQTWLGYIQQVRLTEKWGAIADVHFRTVNNWVQGNNLWLLRAGATYFFNDRTQATAGYAHFHYFAGESHPQDARPEHRLYQQVLWMNNGPKLRLQNRIRTEERWRQHMGSRGEALPGYNFNWRFRAQWQLLYPLGKRLYAPGTLALLVADEAMLNFGKEIVYNTFDQNRIIAGVQWQTGKASFIQAGYMHIFQQQAAGNKYRQSHVARIFYTHNLDLRRRSETK